MVDHPRDSAMLQKQEQDASVASNTESDSGIASSVSIPVEIFSVVSGFLAGDHAFGTLANLNLVNRAVHHETLPVLYETVLFDNVRKLPYYGGGGKIRKPKGFRYTKFYFCVHAHDLIVFNLTSMFPNLVMTVMKSDPSNVYNEFHLCLHKPISTATSFGTILRTPIHHAPYPHWCCGMTKLILNGVSKADDIREDVCAADIQIPLVRAPGTVRYFYLAEGAHLINTDTGNMGASPKWTTGITLNNACFVEPRVLLTETKGHVETTLELLKLAARHQNPQYLQDLDNRLVLAYTHPSAATRCQAVGQYNQWHLELQIEAGAFLELWTQLGDVPEFVSHDMLRYRLKILLCCVVEKSIFQQFFTDFGQFYCHGDSDSRFLPGMGFNHTYLAMASSWGNPNIDDDQATRQTGYWQFAREEKSGLFRLGNIQQNVEAKDSGQQVWDHDFGLLSDLEHLPA